MNGPKRWFHTMRSSELRQHPNDMDKDKSKKAIHLNLSIEISLDVMICDLHCVE